MLNLTLQERQVVLFLAGVFFMGLIIHAAIKVRPSLAGAVKVTQDSVRINLNDVTAAQLERLPGVSPGLAKRIITYRSERGRFGSLDDLKQVKGVGEQRYRKLKELFYAK